MQLYFHNPLTDKESIVQTAYAFAGDRDRAVAAGCNEYLAKPFGRKTLTAIMKKHLVK